MPQSSRQEVTISLGSWITIGCFVAGHMLTTIYLAWSYTTATEKRLTILETNQQHLIRVVDTVKK